MSLSFDMHTVDNLRTVRDLLWTQIAATLGPAGASMVSLTLLNYT